MPPVGEDKKLKKLAPSWNIIAKMKKKMGFLAEKKTGASARIPLPWPAPSSAAPMWVRKFSAIISSEAGRVGKV